jgi:hypothetical protein
MHKFTHVNAFYQIVRTVKKLKDFPAHRIEGPVTFRGTTKLHGTNAGVLHSDGKPLQAQSRTRNITPEDDNHGFAKFVKQENVTKAINNIVNSIRGEHGIGASKDVVLFGEWCGPGLQAGVALNKLPTKQWVLFSVKIIDGEEKYYLDAVPQFEIGDPRHEPSDEIPIYSIMDGPTWSLTVDFDSDESKEAAIKLFEEKTSEVEACCPWANQFSKDGEQIVGLGEGIVWVPVGKHWGNSDLYFKTKGEKHKNTKTKNKKESMNPEILKGINDFIEFAVTDNRLNQGLESIQEMGYELEMKNMSQFIKWVGQDVKRECEAELETNGLEWKQVSKAVTTRAREFFMAKMKEI